MSHLRIALLPGDGIGPEVIGGAVQVLQALEACSDDLVVEFQSLSVGAGEYLRCGDPLPPETLRRARECDAILLGAMGLPHVRWPNGTEMAPQIRHPGGTRSLPGNPPRAPVRGIAEPTQGAAVRRDRLRAVPGKHGGPVLGTQGPARSGSRGRRERNAHLAPGGRAHRAGGFRGRGTTPAEGGPDRQGQRAAGDGVLPGRSSTASPASIPTSRPSGSTSTPPPCTWSRIPRGST